MGLSDREYYRDEQPRGFQLGGEMTVTTKLVILNIVIWIVDDLFFKHALTNLFVLKADIFQHPQHFYTLLTAGFLHATSIWHVLGNMFMLWMFGRDVERLYGKRDYLTTYLTIIVLSNLVWVGAAYFSNELNSSIVGASGGVIGIFVLFVFNFPKRTLLIYGVIPAPAYVIGIIILVMNLIGAAKLTDSNVAYTAHLGGAFFGFVYYKTRWTINRLIPSGKFKSMGRPRLKIVDPDEYEREVEEKIDKILEKISNQGLDSLSAKEKKALEQHSRRMQQKRR